MKRTKSVQEYQMNRDTTVAIKTKQAGDEYTHKIVLTHTVTGRKPLTPATQEEVADLIQNIDLEDDQTELPLSGSHV